MNWEILILQSVCKGQKLVNIFLKCKKGVSRLHEVNKTLVSIKATTTEKLSFVGREGGVSAYATVLIKNRCEY